MIEFRTNQKNIFKHSFRMSLIFNLQFTDEISLKDTNLLYFLTVFKALSITECVKLF
jgi:hypothetical protein